jgi:general secretion pathway protein D
MLSRRSSRRGRPRRAATFAVVAALAATPCVAHAQSRPASETDTPRPGAAFEHAPRRADAAVTLSLENADLPELVRTIGEMTGRRFVIAASPKSFQATVVAPEKVTVGEAYQVFLSVLAANHLTVVPHGRFLKIIDAQDAVHEAPVHSAADGAPGEERFVTYVHRVAHVPADDVATNVLSKLASHDGAVVAYGNLILLTDTATNVQRLLRVLSEIDVAQAEDKVWLEPLRFVAAADVKKELDDLLGNKEGADKGTKGGASPSAGGEARVTKIVALQRPNALLIVGAQAGYERLLELVRSLDVPAPEDGQMHVILLEHADAKKLVGAISEAVSAAGGTPAGGGAAARALEGSVKVSAEETNNALIVTASARDFAAVREVVRRLDQPRRQVYIEAVVMDLSTSRTTEIDTALHGFGDLSGALGAGSLFYGGSNPLKSLVLPTDPTSLQALVLGVRGPSISVPSFLQSALGTTSIPGLGFFLDAFATSSDADILSTPHVLATDNTPADIKVQLHTSLQKNAASYALPSAGAAGSSAASALFPVSAPASSNYVPIGPEIKVTPHLNESDDVRLDVAETISDLTGQPPQGTLGTIDYVERAATTTLTVKDGHTAIIGGLVRNRVLHSATKVPLLGDIPILGALFRSTHDEVAKDNLVLILTPHIIRTEDDMRRVFEARMQERQEFLDHALAFGSEGPVGFDPARGRGLLGEVRASHRETRERRELESAPPPSDVANHDAHPPLDLPNQPARGEPVTLQVEPPRRSVERVEH